MKSSYLRRIEGWRGLKIFGEKFLSLDSATCHLVIFVHSHVKIEGVQHTENAILAERVEQVLIFLYNDD